MMYHFVVLLLIDVAVRMMNLLLMRYGLCFFEFCFGRKWPELLLNLRVICGEKAIQ